MSKPTLLVILWAFALMALAEGHRFSGFRHHHHRQPHRYHRHPHRHHRHHHSPYGRQQRYQPHHRDLHRRQARPDQPVQLSAPQVVDRGRSYEISLGPGCSPRNRLCGAQIIPRGNQQQLRIAGPGVERTFDLPHDEVAVDRIVGNYHKGGYYRVTVPKIDFKAAVTSRPGAEELQENRWGGGRRKPANQRLQKQQREQRSEENDVLPRLTDEGLSVESVACGESESPDNYTDAFCKEESLILLSKSHSPGVADGFWSPQGEFIPY